MCENNLIIIKYLFLQNIAPFIGYYNNLLQYFLFWCYFWLLQRFTIKAILSLL